MSVTFELPSQVEDALKAEYADLSRAATEACLIEFYRQGKLTHAQLAASLDLNRYETDGLLKRHGVLDNISLPELLQQVETLRKGR